jgi:hypothetical protein
MSNVTTDNWNANINTADGMLVVSCTVAAEGSLGGVGLVVNDSSGRTLATAYVEITGNATSANPGINLAGSGISEGDTVSVAADGEADGQHFFVEKRLTVTGG